MPIRFRFSPLALQCLTTRQLQLIAPRNTKEHMIEILSSVGLETPFPPQLFDIFLRGAYVRIGPQGPLYLIRSEEDVAPGSLLDRICKGDCIVVSYEDRGARSQRLESPELRRVCINSLPPPPMLTPEGTLAPLVAKGPVKRAVGRPAGRPAGRQPASPSVGRPAVVPTGRPVGRPAVFRPANVNPLFVPRPVYIPPVAPMVPLYPR